MINSIGISPLGRSRRRAAFSPLSLSPVLWLDFSDLSTLFTDSAGTIPVTADGDVIGYAADKSLNGNHATQAVTLNKPVWKAAIQNGLGVGRGDGSDDYMQFTSIISLTAFTMFFIAKWTAIQDSLIGRFNSKIDSDRMRLNGGASTLYSTPIATGSHRLITWSWSGNGNNVSVYQNTNSVFSENYSCDAAITFLYLFTNQPSIFALNGDIGEALIYPSALSGSDRALVETYFNNKWGVY